MESNRQPQKSSCSDYHSEVSSPVIRITQVTEQGVIFESRESFEIGSWMELGFHIQHPQASDSSFGRLGESEFISTEGMVVGSSFCASADGLPVHEVTLLFGDMSAEDKDKLLRYARSEDQRQQSKKQKVLSSDEGLGLN